MPVPVPFGSSSTWLIIVDSYVKSYETILLHYLSLHVRRDIRDKYIIIHLDQIVLETDLCRFDLLFKLNYLYLYMRLKIAGAT